MILRALSTAFLILAATVCFWPIGTYQNPWRAETERHFAGVPAGTTVTAITSNPSLVWPMVEDHKFKWVSRQMCTWQIFGAGDPKLLPAVQKLVAEELGRKPKLVIVDRRRHIAGVMAKILPPEALAGYTLRKRTRNMESYVLR